MKIQGLILLIASLVLNNGLAYAFSANSVLQQNSEDSSAPSSARSNDVMHATPGQFSNREEATVAGQSAAGRKLSNKGHVRSPARLPMPSRPKPTRNIRSLSRSQDASHLERPTLSKARVVTGRIASAHAPAIGKPAGSAIGGQQFRHGRNLAAVPAALGGSANARRNTPTINGSEIHPRH